MSTDHPLPAPLLATAALNLERWKDVPRWCGSADPGKGKENPSVMDFASRETTADQQRIEDVLDKLLLPESRILHVGVGNSSLARRFAPRVDGILGLTLSDDEQRLGVSLDIENYDVLTINKYSSQLAAITGPFDFIIDNNPASFGCCVGHFQLLMDAYCNLLRPGGHLLTDQAGLDWCYGNGPMKLDFSDLQALCDLYPFAAERLSEQVYALQRLTD